MFDSFIAAQQKIRVNFQGVILAYKILKNCHLHVYIITFEREKFKMAAKDQITE